ncbi:MAG: LPS export ABC transporter periplasmic protein LptC [Desulfobacca sp.]|nr:LPS export ABC transporter periplasmic protein LptC [Desulfobacca sp.]
MINFLNSVKKLKNIFVIGILCVVAFWIGLYAFRIQGPSTPPPLSPAGTAAPGQVGLQEINFVQVKDGVKLWELKAEAVTYQQPQNQISFKKVTLTYFPKGESPVTLVGNLGKLDTQKKNVFIEGEVVISTPEGYELKAPSLQYEDEKREVSTDKEFTFKGPNIFLDGQGVSMNLDTQVVWVKKKAKMTFYRSFIKS